MKACLASETVAPRTISRVKGRPSPGLMSYIPLGLGTAAKRGRNGEAGAVTVGDDMLCTVCTAGAGWSSLTDWALPCWEAQPAPVLPAAPLPTTPTSKASLQGTNPLLSSPVPSYFPPTPPEDVCPRGLPPVLVRVQPVTGVVPCKACDELHLHVTAPHGQKDAWGQAAQHNTTRGGLAALSHTCAGACTGKAMSGWALCGGGWDGWL